MPSVKKHSPGKFFGGFVDPLSLVALSFLLVTLVVGVSVTNNPAKTFLLESWARYNPDALIRQRERTGECTGKYCLAPEVINNRDDPSNQAAEVKEITDTFDLALQGDQNALDTLKAGNVGLYNKVVAAIEEEKAKQVVAETEKSSNVYTGPSEEEREVQRLTQTGEVQKLINEQVVKENAEQQTLEATQADLKLLQTGEVQKLINEQNISKINQLTQPQELPAEDKAALDQDLADLGIDQGLSFADSIAPGTVGSLPPSLAEQALICASGDMDCIARGGNTIDFGLTENKSQSSPALKGGYLEGLLSFIGVPEPEKTYNFESCNRPELAGFPDLVEKCNVSTSRMLNIPVIGDYLSDYQKIVSENTNEPYLQQAFGHPEAYVSSAKLGGSITATGAILASTVPAAVASITALSAGNIASVPLATYVYVSSQTPSVVGALVSAAPVVAGTIGAADCMINGADSAVCSNIGMLITTGYMSDVPGFTASWIQGERVISDSAAVFKTGFQRLLNIQKIPQTTVEAPAIDAPNVITFEQGADDVYRYNPQTVADVPDVAPAPVVPKTQALSLQPEPVDKVAVIETSKGTGLVAQGINTVRSWWNTITNPQAIVSSLPQDTQIGPTVVNSKTGERVSVAQEIARSGRTSVEPATFLKAQAAQDQTTLVENIGLAFNKLVNFSYDELTKRLIPIKPIYTDKATENLAEYGLGWSDLRPIDDIADLTPLQEQIIKDQKKMGITHYILNTNSVGFEAKANFPSEGNITITPRSLDGRGEDFLGPLLLHEEGHIVFKGANISYFNDIPLEFNSGNEVAASMYAKNVLEHQYGLYPSENPSLFEPLDAKIDKDYQKLEQILQVERIVGLIKEKFEQIVNLLNTALPRKSSSILKPTIEPLKTDQYMRYLVDSSEDFAKTKSEIIEILSEKLSPYKDVQNPKIQTELEAIAREIIDSHRIGNRVELIQTDIQKGKYVKISRISHDTLVAKTPEKRSLEGVILNELGEDNYPRPITVVFTPEEVVEINTSAIESASRMFVHPSGVINDVSEIIAGLSESLVSPDTQLGKNQRILIHALYAIDEYPKGSFPDLFAEFSVNGGKVTDLPQLFSDLLSENRARYKAFEPFWNPVIESFNSQVLGVINDEILKYGKTFPQIDPDTIFWTAKEKTLLNKVNRGSVVNSTGLEDEQKLYLTLDILLGISDDIVYRKENAILRSWGKDNVITYNIKSGNVSTETSAMALHTLLHETIHANMFNKSGLYGSLLDDVVIIETLEELTERATIFLQDKVYKKYPSLYVRREEGYRLVRDLGQPIFEGLGITQEAVLEYALEQDPLGYIKMLDQSYRALDEQEYQKYIEYLYDHLRIGPKQKEFLLTNRPPSILDIRQMATEYTNGLEIPLSKRLIQNVEEARIRKRDSIFDYPDEALVSTDSFSEWVETHHKLIEYENYIPKVFYSTTPEGKYILNFQPRSGPQETKLQNWWATNIYNKNQGLLPFVRKPQGVDDIYRYNPQTVTDVSGIAPASEVSKTQALPMEITEIPENINNNPVEAGGVKAVAKYTEAQKTYIKDHFGIEPNDGILITRSQIDNTLPTAQKSSSLISPFGQDSFYVTTGFIFEVPSESIPWVNNGDAGTPMISNDIQKPKSSLSIEEYLSMTQPPNSKYTETVIDFQFGKPGSVRAVYDFREVPTEPKFLLRITNPARYKQIQEDRSYILSSREEWKKTAEKLNVPFINDLPDTSIVQKLRSEDKKITDNFPELPSQPEPVDKVAVIETSKGTGLIAQGINTVRSWWTANVRNKVKDFLLNKGKANIQKDSIQSVPGSIENEPDIIALDLVKNPTSGNANLNTVFDADTPDSSTILYLKNMLNKGNTPPLLNEKGEVLSVIEQIAHGGGGTVYKGVHNGKTVAIKIGTRKGSGDLMQDEFEYMQQIREAIAETWEQNDQLRIETQEKAGVDKVDDLLDLILNPSGRIVSIHDETLGYYMPYLPGSTLDEQVKLRITLKQEAQQAIPILTDIEIARYKIIMKMLDYQGIPFNDIYLKNFARDENGVIKLFDPIPQSWIESSSDGSLNVTGRKITNEGMKKDIILPVHIVNKGNNIKWHVTGNIGKGDEEVGFYVYEMPVANVFDPQNEKSFDTMLATYGIGKESDIQRILATNENFATTFEPDSTSKAQPQADLLFQKAFNQYQEFMGGKSAFGTISPALALIVAGGALGVDYISERFFDYDLINLENTQETLTKYWNNFTRIEKSTRGEIVVPNIQDEKQDVIYSTNFTYYSQKDPRWANNGVVGNGSWRYASCGIMAGAMVTGTDPYRYYEAYLKYFKNLGQERPLTSRGTSFEDNRDVLTSLGYDLVPVSGSFREITKQIDQYTTAGIPVWVNAEIWSGSRWVGHHTIAIDIDENGDIIFNDPWYGQGVSIPVNRIDMDTADNDPGWKVFAIIPPDN